MNIRNVRAIVWDLDGTLLDSFHISEKIIEDITQETERPMPSLETRLRHYHGSLEDTLTNTLDLNEEELEPILNSFLQKQDELYKQDVEKHLYKDALSLCRRAHETGIIQLLITNRDHNGRGSASPRAIVDATELKKYLNEIICGDEAEFRKPDARSLEDWMKKRNLKPENLLIIGDQFVDAHLAKNVAARALLIKRNDEIPHLQNDDHPDLLIVDNLDDVSFD